MNTVTFNCPHCGQSLEAPDDMIGESVKCPSCNKSVIVEGDPIHPALQQSVPKAKNASLKQSESIETNVKQGALIGGLVCFGLGVLMMFISLWTVILYAPLFLAAFILSIVAMAQKRVAGGVILLVLTILIPPILFVAIPSFKIAQSSYEEARSAAQEIVQNQNSGADLSDPNTSSSAQVSMTSKNPKLDAKLGFREYRLGTPLNQFDMSNLRKGTTFGETDTDYYFVQDFDPNLGAAEIDSIQLGFNEGLLEMVGVNVEGEQNTLALKETLIAGYGQPSDTRSFMTETLEWEGSDCVLTLNFDVMGGARARFTSRSVDKKIKDLKLRKAKEGATSGVDSL